MAVYIMSTKSQAAAPKTTSPRPAAAGRQQQLLLLGGIVAVAVIGVIIVIALSGQTQSAGIDYASIPQSRTEDGAFVLGDPDAPITLVEFADFACPHCMDYHATIQQFVRDYVITGQARLEYRMFPTAGGERSAFAGRVAECADELQPGSFWQVYELMYTLAETGRYNDAGRITAETLGVPYSTLLDCTNTADQVVTDTNFGRNRGVSGTPAIMVRYGGGEADWIRLNNVVYDRGSVDYSILQSLMSSVAS
jgi:protein-disulfide isomerase